MQLYSVMSARRPAASVSMGSQPQLRLYVPPREDLSPRLLPRLGKLDMLKATATHIPALFIAVGSLGLLAGGVLINVLSRKAWHRLTAPLMAAKQV